MSGLAGQEVNAGSRARIWTFAMAIAFLLIGGCSKSADEYAGVWKGNCSDYWGVLITPAAGAGYAVTFCGMSGCLEPGVWTPDTSIDGDAAYEVVSSDRIRIRRRDSGYFSYTKCSGDRHWQTGQGRR